MKKKETERHHRLMRARVAAIQHYVATYSDQAHYEDYSDETFINDMLYGIGLAMDGIEYAQAAGFDKFKQALRERLGVQPGGSRC